MPPIEPFHWDLSSFSAGLLAGIAATVALAYPRVGRAFSKTIALLLTATGVGLLTWGIYSAIDSEPFLTMEVGPLTLATAAQGIGWGAGFLAGGIVALVLSFVGRIR